MKKQYHRVLVALALHESDEKVLQRALSVIPADAQVHLLHVCEQHVSSWAGRSGTGGHNPDMVEREAAFPAIKAIADQCGVDASQVHIESGEAADHICEYAVRLNADLIVIGSHAKGGWRAHLGSAANAVVAHAACDVLIVRAIH